MSVLASSGLQNIRRRRETKLIQSHSHTQHARGNTTPTLHSRREKPKFPVLLQKPHTAHRSRVISQATGILVVWDQVSSGPSQTLRRTISVNFPFLEASYNRDSRGCVGKESRSTENNTQGPAGLVEPWGHVDAVAAGLSAVPDRAVSVRVTAIILQKKECQPARPERPSAGLPHNLGIIAVSRVRFSAN